MTKGNKWGMGKGGGVVKKAESSLRGGSMEERGNENE